MLPRLPAIRAEIDGHGLVLMTDPEDRRAMLLETIAQARQSLRLFFYIFADDATGRAVVAALAAARRRGVLVWLMVDGFGCSKTPDILFADLIAAGGVFGRFNPNFGMRYLLRNHQKIVIADDKVAIIGGANVQDSYFSSRPGTRGWHDMMMRVEGSAVRRLTIYYDGLRRWVLGEEHRLRSLLHLLGRRSDKQGTLRWLHNGPFRRMGPLTMSLKRDIESARQLDMVQAYFSPNWGMLRRLGRVISRGGRFRLISASLSDNGVTVAAARHCYKGLLRRGAMLFEYKPQMLHMKLIIADAVVYVGSANFDMRSLFINAEIMLRIEDKAFADSARGLFAAHIAQSVEITPDVHKKRSGLLARLRWFLSYYVVATIDFTVTRRFSLPRQIARIRQKLPRGQADQSP